MSTYECAVGEIQCLVEFRADGSPLRVSSRVKGRTGSRDSSRILWWSQGGKQQSATVQCAILLAQKQRSALTSSGDRSET